MDGAVLVELDEWEAWNAPLTAPPLLPPSQKGLVADVESRGELDG